MLDLLFIQPFGLESPGGGPRILRSLIAGHAGAFQSICTSPAQPPSTRLVSESHVPARPRLGRLESTRITPWLDHFLRMGWEPLLRRRMGRLLRKLNPAHVHLIAHGDDFWPAFQRAEELHIPITMAVHDDFSFHVRPRSRWKMTHDRWSCAWKRADRRVVISEPLGNELNRRYGSNSYEVITDSLDDVSAVRPASEHRLNVYFMGALHLSYRQNFADLMRAMAIATKSLNSNPRLILRGATIQPPSDGIAPEIRPWASEREVAGDLQDADLLYLPLPFEEKFRAFVRLSLSTKMITYLGSGIPILYHGPADSAAAELLSAHRAALLVTTPGVDSLVGALGTPAAQRNAVAEAGCELARRKFLSADVRHRFWKFYDQRVKESGPSKILTH